MEMSDKEKMQSVMNNYNNDYRIRQSARILSVYGGNDINKSQEQERTCEISEDMIEKGMISDSLAYGYGGSQNEPFKFTKTGKELKEKLPSIIATLSEEKGSLEGQLSILRQQIGVDPTNICNSRFLKGTVFLRYPWSMIDPVYDSNTKSYAEKTDQNTLCEQYNSLCSVLMDVCDDIATAQVIVANAEDNKKYTLSVNQLVALSFNDSINKSEIPDLIKAEFTEKKRKKLAKEGDAEKDGSYPIENESDLSNAIQAYGRSKDKPKTKAWIKKRAKELGKEDMLPEKWED